MELKDILLEYCDTRVEVIDLREEIDKRELEIDRIREEIRRMETDNEMVSDTVKGSRQDGTIGSIKITGFPTAEYDRKKSKLLAKKVLFERRKSILEEREWRLLECQTKAEEFIDAIEKSELRQIFTLKYIDERDLTWLRVANLMNKRYPKKRIPYTEDSCRKLHNRYLGME